VSHYRVTVQIIDSSPNNDGEQRAETSRLPTFAIP
jgi:hypothetical protein